MIGIITYPTKDKEELVVDIDPIIDEDGMEISNRLPDCPVLHCLSYRQLSSSYPFLLSSTTSLLSNRWNLSGQWAINPSKHTTIDTLSVVEHRLHEESPRSHILHMLQQTLNGDVLASEYVLLSILSQCLPSPPDALVSDGSVVGNICVHLRNCDETLLSLLMTTLSNLLPRVLQVPLSSVCCRKCEKDYQSVSTCGCGETELTTFQVGAGTVVLIREDVKLNNDLHFLKTLILDQKLLLSLKDGNYHSEVVVPIQCCFIITSSFCGPSSVADESKDPSFISIPIINGNNSRNL